MITIALDPGHGGEDPGAMGAAAAAKRTWCWRSPSASSPSSNSSPTCASCSRATATTSCRWACAWKKRARCRPTCSSRSTPTPSSSRPRAARRCSCCPEKGASSTAARWLANKENLADLIGGVNLRSQDRQLASVLLDLSTTAQINDSLKLGNAVLSEIGGKTLELVQGGFGDGASELTVGEWARGQVAGGGAFVARSDLTVAGVHESHAGSYPSPLALR